MPNAARVCTELYPIGTQGWTGEDYITLPLHPLSSLLFVACTALRSGYRLCSTHIARGSFYVGQILLGGS
jgi:hypothetical protein